VSEVAIRPAGGTSRHTRRAALLAAALATLSLGIAGAARETQSPAPAAEKTPSTLASNPAAPPPKVESRAPAPPARATPHRVADASLAPALFAPHSWHVEPPPAPLPPPPPPPAPTAPPLPYSYVGQYTPQGDATVYFLANADRVIDAHLGDQIDGIYTFESADANQLIFNYMPLNIRQSLPVGAKP
jgi:hypothetical protein